LGYDTLGKVDKQSGRLLLSWLPADDIDIDFHVDGWRDRSELQALQVIAIESQNATTGEAGLHPDVADYPVNDRNTEDSRAADWPNNDMEFRLNDRFFSGGARLNWTLSENLDMVVLASAGRFESNGSFIPQSGVDTVNTERNVFAQIDFYNLEWRFSVKVDDYVQLESGVIGVVTEITVRATIITTLENVEVIVPNSEFVNGKVTNWTHTNNFCRLRILFGVAYGTNKERMPDVVLDGIKDLPQTLKDFPGRSPVVIMKGFSDSSLDFELLVWVKPEFASQQSGTRSAFLWAIDTALVDAGIVVPFPQRNLHIVSGFNQPLSSE
jgi:hypothetical protein